MIAATPKVSICIPAYNYPEFLKRCLLSVLNQTFEDFEVIITDDSCHDKLQEVVAELDDVRIRYYKNYLPLGSPANWNHGLKHARGELIKMLHHDDWFFEKTALEQFVNYFEKHSDASFVFSACYNVNSKGRWASYASWIFFKKLQQRPEVCLYSNGIGAPSVTMFRKEVKEIEFDSNSQWYVDVIFYAEVFKKFKDVGYIKKPLLNITAGASTQVTNVTSGLIKVKEAIYTFHKFGFFKTKKRLPSLLVLLFAEVFKRYGIKRFSELLNFGFDKQTIERLRISFFISKFPIHFKIYALIRRFIVNYIP